jgi:hypothetical protein
VAEFTMEERRVLLEVLEQHLFAMEDTREAMIEDTHTLRSLDVFSSTLQQHDIDTRTVESIKEKIINDKSSP